MAEAAGIVHARNGAFHRLRVRLAQRNGKHGHRACTCFLPADHHRTAVQLYDMLRQRQAESGAPACAGQQRLRGMARKRLSQITACKLALSARNLYKRNFPAAHQPQLDLRRFAGMAHRVGDQVQHAPLDLLPVDPCVHHLLRQFAAQRCAGRTAQRLHAGIQLIKKLAQLRLFPQQPHLTGRRGGKIANVAAQMHQLIECAVDSGHLQLQLRILHLLQARKYCAGRAEEVCQRHAHRARDGHERL